MGSFATKNYVTACTVKIPQVPRVLVWYLIPENRNYVDRFAQ